ncbi:Myb-like DNA-binding domain containing protein [Tritrichomonas foetus]|uniref:Myb-like DNA-binding domain containing protein n=1 Tax=Tritrichomonas foetus TaxID=1144522 RepID=A0A1J4K541_9EUKA|nr:Myb-like DNA-binding domain containing protein [Tritrichomonas foetus]|eukprot:OHT06315.1 Myb-like DNA-binding domain containing protein [Tritrichomonas foetus]
MKRITPCNDTKAHSKRLFTPAEDERIKELVRVLGEKAWKKIAAELVNRTARQCRERWKNYLSPTVKNLPWSESDDQKLIELIMQYGTHWSRIAKFFDFRTDINVKNRWVLLKRKEIKERKIKSKNAKKQTNNLARKSSPSRRNNHTDNKDAHKPSNNYESIAIHNDNEDGNKIAKSAENDIIESEKCQQQFIDFWDITSWEIGEESDLISPNFF